MGQSSPLQRIVSLQPSAWLYQVKFTGEDGKQATDWHDYGVYLNKADAERGMKNAGNGLGCRVVPLFAEAPIPEDVCCD